MARLLVEADHGHALVGSTSVGDYLERKMGHVRARRPPDTLQNHAMRFRKVVAALGRVRLDKLGAHHVDEANRQ